MRRLVQSAGHQERVIRDSIKEGLMLYHIWQMLVAIVGLLGILVSFQSAAYADTMKACEINRPPQGCRATNMWAVRSEMDVPNGAYVNVPNPGCLNDSQTYVNRMI